MKPLISIVIPVYNQLEYTMQCLESLNAYTKEPHEVIIVDNGSTDGTMEYMQAESFKHPEYIYVRNEKNLGCAGAYKLGCQMAQGQYLAILNNDIVLSREWSKGLIDCIEATPNAGLVGARTNFISGPQMVTEVGLGYSDMFAYQEFAGDFRTSFKGLYTPYWQIRPFCGMIKKSVYDSVEGFDPRYFPANCEDDDLCMQLVLTGYRNMICGDVFVHHHGCKSQPNDIQTQEGAARYKMQTDRMYAIWEKKWVKKGTISACMIVKNEEHNMKRCIENLLPYVDEIIIVDTGSKDKTVEIASSYSKVKVSHFKWIDDFSAARNFANDQASGDWILSVDADEVFTGLDKLFKYLLPFHAYRICTRNYTTNVQYSNITFNHGEHPDHEKGAGWFPSTKIRLFPNRKDVRWEYPVHEVVEESIYPLGMGIKEEKECVVHHWSRVDDTKYMGDRSEKYFELLKKNAANGKRDLRCLEQLAVQAQGMKKYDEAEGFWMEVLALDPMGGLVPLNMCHISAERGNWNLAKEWATKAFLLNPDNKDVNQNMALCCYNTGDYLMAEKLAKGLLSKEPMNPLGKALLKAIIELKKTNILGG